MNIALFMKNRSIQMLLLLSVYILIADILPLNAHRALYTASMLIKDILMWVMPVTVAFFIANTINAFEKKAVLFIVSIVIFEFISNLGSVIYALTFAHAISDILPTFQIMSLDNELSALWRLPIPRPSWWSADKGVVIGVALGCWLAFTTSHRISDLVFKGKTIAELMLTKVFSRLIPIFVVGFVAQMYKTNMLNNAIANYGFILAWLALILFVYLSFLFALSAGFSYKKFLSHINNLLPAGSIAITSGCSLSTMPWTIKGAAKNLKNPAFADAIIPTTTNIQQIGDCIVNALLCTTIYMQFYGTMPDFMMLMHFAIAFALARFATAAMIGGAIFVMLPIYESYLNFNGEMVAMILAFNVILDPLVTSANVMANGALCRVFERVWGLINAYKKQKHICEPVTENV